MSACSLNSKFLFAPPPRTRISARTSMARRTESPPSKRTKLESSSDEIGHASEMASGTYPDGVPDPQEELDEDTETDHCSICLQPISDRTIVPSCSHEFCFECLLIWTGELSIERTSRVFLTTRILSPSTDQSRKCPLCTQAIGDYLIHNIRSKYDFQKHYLPPLRTSPQPLSSNALVRATVQHRARTRREREWGRRQRQQREEADELERAVEKRKWVYRHHLFAKVSKATFLLFLSCKAGASKVVNVARRVTDSVLPVSLSCTATA